MLLVIDLLGIGILLAVTVWLLCRARFRAVELSRVSSAPLLPLPEKEAEGIQLFEPSLTDPSRETGGVRWEQAALEYVTQTGTESENFSTDSMQYDPEPSDSTLFLMETSGKHPDTPTISLNIEERNYADPIDGMPFEPCEPIIACRCGLGYRGESVIWIHEHYSGHCTQCGAEISLPSDLL